MVEFVKNEKEERLPGLIYSTVIPCPGICGGAGKFIWDAEKSVDEQETMPFCDSCNEYIDISDILNSLSFGASLNEISQLK